MENKNLEEIKQNIINNIHDTLPNIDTKEGTFIRDVFVNPIADEISGLYSEMKLLEMSQSILTASGEDLDRLAANYFVFRKEATKSQGKIRFYIKGTNKPKLNMEKLPEQLVIPSETIISTLPQLNKDQIKFKTTEGIQIDKQGIIDLPIDSSTGYRFIEVEAESLEKGEHTNIDTGEITQQITNQSQHIEFITNPFSFTGGADEESDASLIQRIGLALSGSNIGTKDGYLSYVLEHNAVKGGKVIGAGDEIMFRDGGYINPQGNYIKGSGGKVDIYVRGTINEEKEYNFKVNNDYVNGDNPYKDIILSHQPINNISSIVSEKTGKVFTNASQYEIEKGTNVDEDGKTNIKVKYYKDIRWDFSIKDNFPDLEYYPLPVEITNNEIKQLKAKVDEELKEAKEYMSNVNYSLNWNLMYTKNNDSGKTESFEKIFYNNQVYKLKAYDSRLNGRTFVMKNNKIYLRVYNNPDYKLIKDKTTVGNSVKARDKIRWLESDSNKNDKPMVDDNLIITYNYDSLINELQDDIKQQKVLTADVLIKQAKELEIEIIIHVNCYPSYDPINIKSQIITDITSYIHDSLKLGGKIDKSDIIAIAKQIEGVDSVDTNNIQLNEVGTSDQNKIKAKDNEYLKIKNIQVEVNSNEKIIL
jgi:uncharacterized phage protein gp47/JayE